MVVSFSEDLLRDYPQNEIKEVNLETASDHELAEVLQPTEENSFEEPVAEELQESENSTSNVVVQPVRQFRGLVLQLVTEEDILVLKQKANQAYLYSEEFKMFSSHIEDET